MTKHFLYARITKGLPTTQGTIAEPQGAPVPRFALASSVNWMSALALIVEDENISWADALDRYQGVSKASSLSDKAKNTIFEQLLLSLHHLSALKAMDEIAKPMDLNRLAIMDWYYGVYCGASAMTAAKDGSQHQDHAGTAKHWDHTIAAAGKAFPPFGFRLSTLEKKTAKQELLALSSGTAFGLTSIASNRQEADAACLSYLSGTRDYREWQICEQLRSRELRQLGLQNFRSKEAKDLRDQRLSNHSLGFILQAFRYRGKANYRDALYLTYESTVAALVEDFIKNMEIVLRGFLIMAGAFSYQRLGSNDWKRFVDDLNSHLKFSVMPNDVWS